MVRFQTYAQEGLLPKSFLKGLDALPNYSKWSKAIHERHEVMYVFDGPGIAASTAKRIEAMRAAK